MAVEGLLTPGSQRDFRRIKIQPFPQAESRNPVWIRRLPVISFLLRAECENFGVNDMHVVGVRGVGVRGPDWKTLGNLPERGSLEQGPEIQVESLISRPVTLGAGRDVRVLCLEN